MNWARKYAAFLVVAIACMGHCIAATPDSCQTLRKHGQKAEAQACFESLVHSNTAYYRAEGYWGLEQYDQANEQFRIATSAADSDPLYKVRWGMLLHQRFNNTDSVNLQEALQKDPKNAHAY
jgi:cellulose synthase operon protein C